MSNVLIGVGGSGQHVVHAYLRMLALANVKPQDVPHVYIIDADASVQTGAKGDGQLCANIRLLHNMLVKPLARENRAHFALLRPYFQQNSESTPGKAQDNLELQSCPSWLADIFLTDETAETLGGAGDRTVDLLQGMMANAKVGAMSFGYKLMRSQGESDATKAVNFGFSDPESGENYSLLRDVKSANVAIVGSTFGGTGSGVIPALVRYLASITAGGPRLIRGFMTLPWFEIDSTEGTSAAATVGTLDPKARNAALGLRTYLDELSTGLPRSNYLVAQFPGEPAKRADRGNYNQGEDPHIFNVILATSIQQFLWSSQDKGAIDGDGTRRKLLGLITSRNGESDGQFDAALSHHLRFRSATNNNISLLDITLEADVLALAIEKGADFIRGANFKVVGADARTEPEALLELAKVIATSYDKKPLVKRGVIGLRKDVAPNDVYSALADALHGVAKLIRGSLVWLDEHRVTSDNPQGAKYPNVSHLFNKLKGTNEVSAATEEDLKTRWPAYGLNVKNKQNKGQTLADSTARIAQAFTLFINVFFGGKNLAQELHSLAKNQPDAPIYAVAANMLAELVYHEVVEARAATRKVAMADDLQDEAAPSELTSAFFKALKIQIKADSSRTCVIAQGDLDATIGDPGTPSFQGPIQERHPLSLRHIDPYVGITAEQNVDLASVSKLSSSDSPGYFPESALRGIPNVIAPLILQDWRLARKSSAKEGPLQITPGVRDLRLSETGLFQHAARIVEAGFWLLFTQDPRVELVTVDADTALTSSKFAALVNQELRSYSARTDRSTGGNALPRTVIAFRRPNENRQNQPVKPILVHDPKAGWYLAANSGARKFMTKLMATLPSVIYGSTPLDAAWRGDRLDAKPKVEPDSFEANTASAFADYLAGLLSTHGVGDREVGWLKSIRFVVGVLQPQLRSSGEEKDRVGLNIRDRLSFLDARGTEVPVALRTPKALSAISADLFVSNPAYFFVGDERRSASWGGVWPLKGAAWEHLSLPEKSATKMPNPMISRLVRASDAGADTRSAWHVESITLPLRQLGSRKFDKPFDHEGLHTEIPGFGSDLVDWAGAVWPKFEAPDWTYYLAGGGYYAAFPTLPDFDLRLNSLRVEDVELRYFGDYFEPQNAAIDGGDMVTFGLIGVVKYMMPIKLKGWPRAVELVVNGRVLGSIPIYLKMLPETAQSKSCELAMDFGTSNTCLAIKLDDAKEPEHLPLLPGERMLNGDSLPYFTRVLGVKPSGGASHSAAGERIQNKPTYPIFFFQSFSKTEQDGVARSVPSELISMRSSGTKGQAEFLSRQSDYFIKTHWIAPNTGVVSAPAALKQAIVAPHFTPIPPVPSGLKITELAQFLQAGLFKDFKWPNNALEPGANVAFRAVYVEQLLVAAMASLRWMGIHKAKRFVATYPGAFGVDYRNGYFEQLDKILSTLLKQTGVKLTQRITTLRRSETIAALAAVNPNSHDVSITIDMGGGTTDVGIIVPNMQGEGVPFAFMSSIRYAGNNLLEAVLSVAKLRQQLGDVSDDDAKRLDQLKFMIRAADDSLKEPSVSGVATAFFEGLFEYVFTLLAAVASDPRFPLDAQINVHLFGNGFRLTNVFIGRDVASFFESIKSEIATAGLLAPEILQRITLQKSQGDTKLSLIQGALKAAFDEEGSGGGQTDELLAKVEAAGHGRVALWYPCVMRKGVKGQAMALGTREERDQVVENHPNARKELTIDTRDVSSLKAAFPLTSKYWDETNAVAPIFNNVPQMQLIALGQYYLEGRQGELSSFATVVLPEVAKRSKTSQKDTQLV